MEISTDHTCQSPDNRSVAYATKEDFCRIFGEQMKSLYLLSLVLTANHEMAEQCFVKGLEGCSAGRPVFKEWAHSWTRRTIVQGAIRLISPTTNATPDSIVVAVTSIAAAGSESEAFFFAITQLPSFERFAFIMSTLERYSDKDCCVLLGCSRRDLIDARTRALEQLSSFQPC